MKKLNISNFRIILLAVILGALIWILSFPITGKVEAWDSWYYYLSALIIVGVITGFLGKTNRFYLWPIAIFIGQLIGMILVTFPHSHTSPAIYKVGIYSQPGYGVYFWPIGLIFVVLSTLIVFIGVGVGIGLRWLSKRLFR